LSLRPSADWFRPRSLFGKYVVAFVGLVVLVFVINSGIGTWFTYNDTLEVLVQAQSDKAEAAARHLEQSVDDFERQISFATRASATTIEQRLQDYELLLHQVPEIDTLVQLDSDSPRPMARFGSRACVSMVSILIWRLQCRTRGATPARRLPISSSNRCRSW
jgi:hypothetical protein